MARSSHPSQPSSQEHNLRRLSHGSASSERPIRAQSVLGLVASVLLVAVPLYLLRRPGDQAPPTEESHALRYGGVVQNEVDAGIAPSAVLLGPLQRVRCGASSAQQSGEGGLCDTPPVLESALRQSIMSNVDCAPKSGKAGSINYVLEVDFSQNRLNVFAGRSGQWRGARARKAVTCVQRSLPPVPWTEVAHQHQYYAIAILASYPASEGATEPPGDNSADTLPSFD